MRLVIFLPNVTTLEEKIPLQRFVRPSVKEDTLMGHACSGLGSANVRLSPGHLLTE